MSRKNSYFEQNENREMLKQNGGKIDVELIHEEEKK